ncbi:type II toxin-antitoxin system RelE/ParE family toxin [Pelotomaculum terephthalicicum JT]|uniref:type II toxin-antitoxin system RelE/ParE family toxin n=1 Tax=Pelotomaculum TaxID=191373 RepID=UPI0009CD5AA1|nr:MULTISPECIES: type II toxin-antitoxin system RelE/ParE family toxin [Pelotomaculum]MCG9969591.1 type II toxin-antitoxin system RelE/ParE family toxin [Pelotomaculum terephthalicicum JT]OPX84549.1 MAG: Toxin ParE1 [Pelotomaculum sp. PtaB.Bin117]
MRKPKYKLELLTPAQRELEEIALVHMELVGVESARKITDRIYNALDHLRSHPNMGIACIDKMLRSESYRMLICGHYLCFYRLLGETIFVYHIVDGRANYTRLLADLPMQGESND